jgi:DNA-binding MarR family transcriptional regulator
MQSKIIELLKAEPNLRATEIIAKLQCNPASAKVVLNKMVKKDKLVRSQIDRLESVKSGRKSVYAYTVKA